MNLPSQLAEFLETNALCDSHTINPSSWLRLQYCFKTFCAPLWRQAAKQLNFQTWSQASVLVHMQVMHVVCFRQMLPSFIRMMSRQFRNRWSGLLGDGLVTSRFFEHSLIKELMARFPLQLWANAANLYPFPYEKSFLLIVMNSNTASIFACCYKLNSSHWSLVICRTCKISSLTI